MPSAGVRVVAGRPDRFALAFQPTRHLGGRHAERACYGRRQEHVVKTGCHGWLAHPCWGSFVMDSCKHAWARRTRRASRRFRGRSLSATSRPGKGGQATRATRRPTRWHVHSISQKGGNSHGERPGDEMQIFAHGSDLLPSSTIATLPGVSRVSIGLLHRRVRTVLSSFLVVRPAIYS